MSTFFSFLAEELRYVRGGVFVYQDWDEEVASVYVPVLDVPDASRTYPARELDCPCCGKRVWFSDLDQNNFTFCRKFGDSRFGYVLMHNSCPV